MVSASSLRAFFEGTLYWLSASAFYPKQQEHFLWTVSANLRKAFMVVWAFSLRKRDSSSEKVTSRSQCIPSPTGKKGWCARAIDTLLSNEKYRGNSTATAPLTSYETKSTQRSRYMYSKHHIAIIDDTQFEAVAEEKKRRSNIE